MEERIILLQNKKSLHCGEVRRSNLTTVAASIPKRLLRRLKKPSRNDGNLKTKKIPITFAIGINLSVKKN